jgi:hypothetical protein
MRFRYRLVWTVWMALMVMTGLMASMELMESRGLMV